jgi:hypothetical protein
MSHTALVSDGLLLIVAVLTLLLVMFLFAVIRMGPEPADSAGLPMPAPPAPELTAPELTAPELTAPRPAPGSPVPPVPPARRQLWTSPLPARTAGQSGGTGDAARPEEAPAPRQNVIRPPLVSGSPPWGPAPKPPGLG